MRYRLSTGRWPRTLDPPVVVQTEAGAAWLVKVVTPEGRYVPITWTPAEDAQPTRAARDEWIATKVTEAQMALE